MPPESNKLNHIFGKSGHKLGPLVSQFGNEQTAFQAVEQAAVAEANRLGLSGVFEIALANVGGFNVTVRGNIVNGILRIGTFFIV